MSNIAAVAALVGEIAVLVGVITPVIISIGKISNGTKCQLRSEMLRIYYHHREKGLFASMSTRISSFFTKRIRRSAATPL